MQFPASWSGPNWTHGGPLGEFFAFASLYSGRKPAILRSPIRNNETCLLVGFLHSTQRDAFAPQVVRAGPAVDSPALRFNRLSHLPHPGHMRLLYNSEVFSPVPRPLYICSLVFMLCGLPLNSGSSLWPTSGKYACHDPCVAVILSGVATRIIRILRKAIQQQAQSDGSDYVANYRLFDVTRKKLER